MDLNQAQKRFELSDEEVKRIEAYMKKAETAELKYCSEHDYEWYQFEAGCPACLKEESCFKKEEEERISEEIARQGRKH